MALSAEQRLNPLRFDEAEGHHVSLERKVMAFLACRAPASAPHFPDAIACRSLDASPCSSASRSRPDHRVSVESLTQDPGNLAQNLWRRRSLVPWNTSSFPVGALYFPRHLPQGDRWPETSESAAGELTALRPGEMTTSGYASGSARDRRMQSMASLNLEPRGRAMRPRLRSGAPCQPSRNAQSGRPKGRR